MRYPGAGTRRTGMQIIVMRRDKTLVQIGTLLIYQMSIIISHLQKQTIYFVFMPVPSLSDVVVLRRLAFAEMSWYDSSARKL